MNRANYFIKYFAHRKKILTIFYRNRAVNFDDTKWINPQFSAIIRKVNLVASSFQLKVPKIHKVCNGLYLMAP